MELEKVKKTTLFAVDFNKIYSTTQLFCWTRPLKNWKQHIQNTVIPTNLKTKTKNK